MNKTDLVEIVIQKTGLTRKLAREAVEVTIESIQDALKDNDSVRIVGFGTFETRQRASRAGRNPQTGEEIYIPATVVPAFKPGKKLKEAVAS